MINEKIFGILGIMIGVAGIVVFNEGWIGLIGLLGFIIMLIGIYYTLKDYDEKDSEKK